MRKLGVIIASLFLCAGTAGAETPAPAENIDNYPAPAVDYVSPAPEVPYMPDIPRACLAADSYYQHLDICGGFQPAPEYNEALAACLGGQQSQDKRIAKLKKKCGKKCKKL